MLEIPDIHSPQPWNSLDGCQVMDDDLVVVADAGGFIGGHLVADLVRDVGGRNSDNTLIRQELDGS